MRLIQSSVFMFLFLIIFGCDVYKSRPEETQKIHIRAGWSFFSTYLEINEDIEILFAENLDKIEAIENYNDSTMYYPALDEYRLNRIHFYKGYMIKAYKEFSVTFKGKVCRPERYTFTIKGPKDGTELNNGTMIPYLRTSAMATEELHQIIGNPMELIADDIGNVYWFEFDIDQIDSLQPGKAYRIVCSEETRFSFPENDR